MALNTKGKKSSLKEDAFIYEKRSEDDISGKQRWKTLSRKERQVQFREYYLQPIIIGLFVICVAVFFIYHDFISKKKVIYQNAIINEVILEEPLIKFSEEFVSYIKHDPEKEEASFHLYYVDQKTAIEANAVPATDIQHISAKIYAGDLDTIIADQAAFHTYNKVGLMLDLNQFLTKEERVKLEPYLYRLDDKTLNPENKPYGIYLDKSPTYNAMFENGKRRVGTPIFGVLHNSERKEETKELLYYLFPDILSK